MHASILPAIGQKHKVAHGSMIMALCWQNSMEQVAARADAAEKTAKRLRALFPL
jgi:cysteine sulfinate desulfinase/cysteine desulfurase-like protein